MAFDSEHIIINMFFTEESRNIPVGQSVVVIVNKKTKL